MSGHQYQFSRMFSQWTGDDAEAEPAWVPPEWFGPPADELGVSVPLSLVLARSDRAAVALRSATAYSTGVLFDLVAVARGLPEREANRLFQEQHLAGEEEPSDAMLRIGFELPDGTRVSNLGRGRRPLDPAAEPDGPVLNPCGGGGGSAGGGRVEMQHSYWLWPLPVPGLLRVYVEWPALEISLSSVEVESEPLLEAAARSQPLWPD